MNIADRIFLLKNGYTKEEIEAMAAGEPSEKVATTEPEAQEVTNGGEDHVETTTTTEMTITTGTPPVESETDKLIKALGLKLDNAISAIHKSNVNNLEGAGNEQLSVDDVLAQIINPTIKGGKA